MHNYNLHLATWPLTLLPSAEKRKFRGTPAKSRVTCARDDLHVDRQTWKSIATDAETHCLTKRAELKAYSKLVPMSRLPFRFGSCTRFPGTGNGRRGIDESESRLSLPSPPPLRASVLYDYHITRTYFFFRERPSLSFRRSGKRRLSEYAFRKRRSRASSTPSTGLSSRTRRWPRYPLAPTPTIPREECECQCSCVCGRATSF